MTESGVTEEGGTGAGEGPPGHRLPKVAVRVTMLAMPSAPPPGPFAALPPGFRIARHDRPDPDVYRTLYRHVGEPWGWTERARWTDAEIVAALHDPAVELWMLLADGDPAGFAELDRRTPGEVEIKYFGLLPGFIGQGLGTHLLRFAIRQAWSAGPTRLWLHTCTLDHPAALGLYRREGFVPFHTEERWVEDPRHYDLNGPHVAPV